MGYPVIGGRCYQKSQLWEQLEAEMCMCVPVLGKSCGRKMEQKPPSAVKEFLPSLVTAVFGEDSQRRKRKKVVPGTMAAVTITAGTILTPWALPRLPQNWV